MPLRIITFVCGVLPTAFLTVPALLSILSLNNNDGTAQPLHLLVRILISLGAFAGFMAFWQLTFREIKTGRWEAFLLLWGLLSAAWVIAEVLRTPYSDLRLILPLWPCLLLGLVHLYRLLQWEKGH